MFFSGEILVTAAAAVVLAKRKSKSFLHPVKAFAITAWDSSQTAASGRIFKAFSVFNAASTAIIKKSLRLFFIDFRVSTALSPAPATITGFDVSIFLCRAE